MELVISDDESKNKKETDLLCDTLEWKFCRLALLAAEKGWNNQSWNFLNTLYSLIIVSSHSYELL
jgi:hypothetical protein